MRKNAKAYGMQAVTIKLKTGESKTIIFETEEKALKFYHKYKSNKLIDKLVLNYTKSLIWNKLSKYSIA